MYIHTYIHIYVYIAGDGPLGGWLGEPKRMTLGAERTLLTGIKVRDDDVYYYNIS